MYHNDPRPDPSLVDDDVDAEEGVDDALGAFEGDLEKEEDEAVAAIDRLEEGAHGSGLLMGPPGQRHIEDFLEEYVAAPVTQNPCLCLTGKRIGEERKGEERKGKGFGLKLELEQGRIGIHVMYVQQEKRLNKTEQD